MRKLNFAGILGVLLALAMIFTACPGDAETDEGGGGSTSSGARPSITLQPVSRDYVSGDVISELKVEADGSGTLSYQWYEASSFANSGGTAISGETASGFTPGSAEGAKYYYVVVTNTTEEGKATLASSPARIQILAAAAPAPEASITVNDAEAAQYVRGFGGMSNAFGIGAPARYMELRDIDTMFGPDGLGYKILRICVWPYDLSEIVSGAWYPEMGNQIYYEIVKRVNRYGGFVLASPWTPPAEWKTNGSLTGGGHLLPQFYSTYANYLKNFCQTMSNNGAPIYTISIQNEPSFQAQYDGMEWTSEEHRDFLKAYGGFTQGVPGYGGGKALDRVLVTSGEPHQNSRWNDPALNDPDSAQYLDIIAYHIYGSLDSRYPLALNMGKETWMTEHNINSQNESLYLQDSTWNYVWLVADEIHQVIANNDSSAFIWWYAKRFYSFIGDGSYGTINGAVLPRGYVLSHYAKYATDTVRVGATLSSHPSAANVRVSAYQRKTDKNTDNEKKVEANEDSISLVLYDKRTTPAAPTDIKINLPSGFTATGAYGIISDDIQKHAPVLVVLAQDGNSAVVTLPANTIISLKFTK